MAEKIKGKNNTAAPATESPADKKAQQEIGQAIVTAQPQQLTNPAKMFTRNQIELIKRTVAKGASDDELAMFLAVCNRAGLDPFVKQVHLVPRWDSREGREVRTIQIGIDGFRATAESSGQYAGNDDAVFAGEEELAIKDGKFMHPKQATATVYKIFDGQRFPFTATARWGEYYPGEKMGFQWHKKPYLMLAKCAEALALRKAFPKLLGGVYVQEEMDQVRAVGPEEQAGAAFGALQAMVKKATLDELKTLQAKMKTSKKYTAEQKAEFGKLVKERTAELSGKPDVAHETTAQPVEPAAAPEAQK